MYFKPTEFAVILDEVKVVLLAQEPSEADGPSGVASETQSVWVCSSVSGQKPLHAGAPPPQTTARGRPGGGTAAAASGVAVSAARGPCSWVPSSAVSGVCGRRPLLVPGGLGPSEAED